MPWYNPFSWNEKKKSDEPKPKTSSPLLKVASWISRGAIAIGMAFAASVQGGNSVSNCIRYDAHAEFQVGLVQMQDGKTYAIPTNVLDKNPEWKAKAIPSNAIPVNAIPSNAIPSNAIPSNAIPAEAVAKNLIASKAIPSNAIPSNYTQTLGSKLAVFTESFIPQSAIPAEAIPAEAIPSNDLYTPEPLAFNQAINYASLFPITAFPSIIDQQTFTQSRPSWLCQGEHISSLETRACKNGSLLCGGGYHSGSYIILGLVNQPKPSVAEPTVASPTTVVQTACDETFSDLLVYTGEPTERNLQIYFNIQNNDTFTGGSYQLELTGASDLLDCSLINPGLLVCFGPYLPAGLANYALIPAGEDCQLTSGAIALREKVIGKPNDGGPGGSENTCKAGESYHSPTSWWSGGCCTDGYWCVLPGDTEAGCWNNCP